MMISLDSNRLWARIEALSRFTRPDQPWTRRAFTPEFAAARAWLAENFAASGLAVSTDAAANLIGRREGGAPGLAPLVVGSHCDTVPAGGRFDGIAGVATALEIAQSFAEAGIALRHPLEVIDFLSEEPSDYGASCIGSRAVVGALTPAMLAARNAGDEPLSAAIERVGGTPGALAEPLRRPGGIAAFLELHIEQNTVLESRGEAVGIVTAIVGIHRLRITVTGRTDHAGSTPMHARHDALVGAARVIDAAHRLAREMTGNPDYVVATVGRIAVSPNAANAIPGSAEMILDLRSTSDDVLAKFPRLLQEAAAPGLADMDLAFACELMTRARPAPCAPEIREALARAARAKGHAALELPSGAGHDAMQIAEIAPMGMVFVPCRGGRSHCPEEWAEAADIAAGAEVLAAALLDLDARLG
ncbi:MAG: Zn-dependent hydrolase [Rhodospirillaceae bacterium]